MSKQSLNTVTPWWIYTCIPGLLIKLGSIHIITFVCLQLLIYLKGGLKGEPRGSRGASVFYLISLYDIWIIRNLSKTFINISFQPIFFKFSSRSLEALNSNNIFHRSFYILKIFPKHNSTIPQNFKTVITSFEIPILVSISISSMGKIKLFPIFPISISIISSLSFSSSLELCKKSFWKKKYGERGASWEPLAAQTYQRSAVTAITTRALPPRIEKHPVYACKCAATSIRIDRPH